VQLASGDNYIQIVPQGASMAVLKLIARPVLGKLVITSTHTIYPAFHPDIYYYQIPGLTTSTTELELVITSLIETDVIVQAESSHEEYAVTDMQQVVTVDPNSAIIITSTNTETGLEYTYQLDLSVPETETAFSWMEVLYGTDTLLPLKTAAPGGVVEMEVAFLDKNLAILNVESRTGQKIFVDSASDYVVMYSDVQRLGFSFELVPGLNSIILYTLGSDRLSYEYLFVEI
jgi:hypothetical protein